MKIRKRIRLNAHELIERMVKFMVTIKDIAKACGVSVATVSKALNNYPDISAQTAEKIRQTAEELHYLPNSAARQLKTNMSHNIGVVFVDGTNSGLTHQYFSTILNSAKEEIEQHGYDLTFISQNIVGGSFLEHCRYRKCDGVLIASVDFESEQVRELLQSNIPTVSIEYVTDGQNSVMSDNVDGACALTQYLIEKGHRKIAFVHGEMTSVTRKRLLGFYRACGKHNIEVPDLYIVEAAFHDPGRSAAAVRQLLNLKDPPTAIMFPDDYSYLGAMTELEKMGIRVPEDLSVVGYDGISLVQYLRPKLTTYYQDAEAIGRRSARRLIEIIEDRNHDAEEQIKVSGRILEGNSVKQL